MITVRRSSPVATVVRTVLESFPLDDLAIGRKNNFDLLRFFAATLVIFSHCFAIGASRPEPVWTYFGSIETGGSLGVLIFFVISGFLVTQSFVNRGGALGSFLLARGLRIYPALIVAVFFSCLLARLTSPLSLRSFLLHPDTGRFLLHNSLAYRTEYMLPEAFSHNILPGTVNGSLWTLPLELQMYLICATVGVLGIFGGRAIFNGVFLCAVLVAAVVNPDALPLVVAHSTEAPRLAFAFFLGAFFLVNRSHIRIGFVWGAALLIAIVWFHTVPNFREMYVPAVAYLVLLLAYHPRIYFAPFNRIGDYSYGLYIFAFPIQQTIAYFKMGIPPAPLFFWAYPFILLAAVLSWHFIEKPALRLKARRRDVSPPALV